MGRGTLKLKIHHKTMGLCILVVALFSSLVFAYIMPAMRDSLIDKKKETIRELCETAVGVLSHYHARYLKGALKEDEAKAQAIAAIKALRYGPEMKDYFWINDMRPVMIMHPYRPDLDGKDVSGFADPHGTRIFMEMVNVCRLNKKGFVNYMWQWKDDQTKIVPKISYATLYEPWGWIVGTGIYIEDVNAEIMAFFLRMAAWSGAIILIALAVGVIIGRNVNGIIKSILGETKRLVNSASEGNLRERADPDRINFEFRDIVVGINNTVEAITGPLNVAAGCMDRIAKGDIPPRITEEYKGDFSILKNNINMCIDAVNSMIGDADMLAKSAVEGMLSTRGGRDDA